MSANLKAAYAAVLVLALYGLVLIGKVDAAAFFGLAMSILAGLGVLHAANTPASQSTPAAPAAPEQPKEGQPS
jgi:hypothetical protein